MPQIFEVRVRHSAREAFTIVESVVVCAITVTLISLLMGAVQRTRAAADRAACLNKLRQLGTADHQPMTVVLDGKISF
jgi:type II secretory pathway pseudopilin PulG